MTQRIMRCLAAALLLGLAATATAAETKDKATAIFAGGCFWCVESDFDHVPGVLETVSGYTGGTTEKPTYKSVSAGIGGHYEAVRITYDPTKVSYEKLLDAFWHSVDPTDPDGQFCDKGSSYRTAIFAVTPEQKKAAEESRRKLAESGVLKDKIVTKILEAGPFTPAEDYHQNYYKVNSFRYRLYRFGCGRDARLKELWGDDAMRGLGK
jgi:peptide-methionine (S)-S-oxide reductase